ncbi:LysR substrate-binding domain-containing protein [Nocardia sp. NPDC003693]
MVELRQLRYFVAVAEELHFRRAAERLFISTPTLSQQIRAVERDVGGPLLIRGSQGVELTAAGEVLLKAARGVLEAAEAAMRETRAVADPERALLRLGLVNGAPRWLATRIETLLETREPGARVRLTGGPATDQLRLLDREDVDVAVLRLPVRLPDHLVSTPLAAEELGIIMSREHPLAAGAHIEPAQLRDRELIMFPRDTAPELHDSLLAQLRDLGAAVMLSALAVGQAQLLALLPLRPAAIGLGSARAAAATPGLAWRPLRPRPLTITYIAAWRPAARNSVLHALAEALTGGCQPAP